MVEREKLQGEITAETKAGGQKPSRFCCLMGHMRRMQGAILADTPQADRMEKYLYGFTIFY